MENDIIIIGTRIRYGGEETCFGITPKDARQHLEIIGKTGVGKTTLLRNLLIQHACAGRGFALVDPHGDLAEEIFNHIPLSRADDVVYFNPGDLEYPVGMNLIGQVPPEDRHLVAAGIVSAFKGIWDSWGPRMEYILYNAVVALLDCKNATLLGLPRLLTDPVYREWVVKQIKDPVVRAFWITEFAAYDERFMREAIAPIQNKIGQFLASPPVRNILGQVKSKIDFRFMMDTCRIFIANLSKGQLGETHANLLGSLVVTQFQLAAMSRATVAEDARRDFFLVIDEFQNFTTDAFASVLSEARKYRLCLTLSHQYVDQLTPKVRSAVLGNVGGVISFRVGSTDAEILEREFGNEYRVSQFVGLERYEVFARVLVDGETVGPFRARTLSPISNAHTKRDTLIARSREKYSTRRSVVEEKINRWFASQENDA